MSIEDKKSGAFDYSQEIEELNKKVALEKLDKPKSIEAYKLLIIRNTIIMKIY